MKHSLKYTFLILAAFLLFAGCAKIYKPYNKTVEKIEHTEKDVPYLDATNESTSKKAEPPVVSFSEYYSDLSAVSLAKPPLWLTQHVEVQANRMPINQLLARLLRNTPAMVTYQMGVSRGRNVSLYYSGTLKGALDKISAQTGYHYSIKGDKVIWNAFVTKTFDISFMPGSARYLVGQTADQQDSGDRGSSSGTGTVIKANLNTSQYSNLQGNVSVWKDLEKTLNELKSKEGKVVISESTTMVTVTDYPDNIRAIQRYIRKLNASLSRQVSIKVQVLEIELKDEFNLGIDWDLIARRSGSNIFRYQTALGAASNIASTAASAVDSVPNGGQGLLTLGREGNTRAFFRALETQGKLRIVTQPTLVTTNNQLAEIRITQDTAYLESVSNTAQGTGDNPVVTATLTPGVVTDGFTLYLLPKIQKRDVFLQISSELSTLQSLTKVSNEPDNKGKNNAGQFQSIQVPVIASKHFNQRTVIPSGDTLIVTGFKQARDEMRTSTVPGSNKITELVKSRGSQSRNIQTLLLITPIILEK